MMHALDKESQLHHEARDGEHPVDNAPAFLQLRDKYKQELVEDARLSKAADLAAKQHVFLANDVPDAGKRPQLKAVGRQLRHWAKKVRRPFGAPVSGVRATGAPATSPGENDFDVEPVQACLTQLVKTAQGIKCLAWGTLQTRRKTTRTTQTQHHPECQKETSFHDSRGRVGYRVTLFKRACIRTLGYTQ